MQLLCIPGAMFKTATRKPCNETKRTVYAERSQKSVQGHGQTRGLAARSKHWTAAQYVSLLVCECRY